MSSPADLDRRLSKRIDQGKGITLSPADLETRRARQDAHAAFDPLWRRKMAKEGISKTKARGRGYKWLAAQIGMDPKHCHIGEMTAADAMRVVEVCRGAKRRPSTPPLREGNDKDYGNG